MTENKLNPFEDYKDEDVSSVDSDAVDRELSAKQHKQAIRKANTDVSYHAYLLLGARSKF